RPSDRRRHDGERAGGRAVRRLPLLVPAIPRRRGSYLRQSSTLLSSGADGWSCQRRTALPFVLRMSSTPTFFAWKRRYASARLLASWSLAPKRTVTALSGRRTRRAPPEAVEATKSSASEGKR